MPIHTAAKSNKVDAIKLLMQHGASASDKDNEGFSPLLYATWTGNIEAMQLLLSYGASN